MSPRRGRPLGKKNVTGKTKKIAKHKVSNRQRPKEPKVQDESQSKEQAVLPWPNLRRVDSEHLPRMSALATNHDDEGGDREDLNSLQLELEALLSAAAVRRRQLEEQLGALRTCEKRGSRPKLAPRPSTPTPIPPEAETSVLPIPPPPNPERKHRGPPRGRRRKLKDGETRPPAELPSRGLKPCGRNYLEKNHTSHKFWMNIDPYCDEFSEEDIHLLQDLIHHNRTVVPKLLEEPPLGEHYTHFWDFSDDVKSLNGNSSVGSQSEETDSKVYVEDSNVDAGSSHISLLGAGIGSAVKRKLRECTASIKRSFRGSLDKKLSGSSPSKLVALLSATDVKTTECCIKLEEEEPVPAKISRIESKYLNEIHSQACIERRQRLNAEALGELPCGPTVGNQSHNLLDELRRAQAELRLLSENNNHELLHIAGQLQKELSRQKLISHLRKADEAVVDLYQARSSGKLLKHVPTPEETAQAWQTLSNRNEILHQLDILDCSWSKKTPSTSTPNSVRAPAS